MLNTERISLSTIIFQSPGNIVSDMGEEKVMMSVQKGKYYNLGVIGGMIWENIKAPISAGDLINNLAAEYNVEYNECKEQVIVFMEQLLTEGLIEISN